MRKRKAGVSSMSVPGMAMPTEPGRIALEKLVYIYEDTGYDTEKAVATFKKMMAQHSPVIMYGESTGQGKAIAPELNSRYRVLYGSTSFSSELADPKNHPYSFVSGPTYSDQFGILLEYIAKNPKKGNLGVGIYQDETGVTPILESVKRAEEKILSAEDTKSYLPISGMPGSSMGAPLTMAS